MKIVLDYDPVTGKITDPKDDSMITNWVGLGHCALEGEAVLDLNTMINLKEAGYTVEEMVTMRKKGLL